MSGNLYSTIHRKGKTYNQLYGSEKAEEIRAKLIGRKPSAYNIKRSKEVNTGRIITQETRNKLRAKGPGYVITEEIKQKLRKFNKGKKLPQETKDKISKAVKEFWSNKERASQRLKQQREGMDIKPNKPELIVLNLLNKEYPNEWEYVGDGKIIIEKLIPDFININGQKLIIEVFGNYWHTRNRSPAEKGNFRRQIYNRYGYNMLVVWESDLKDIEKVKKTITTFIEGGKEPNE